MKASDFDRKFDEGKDITADLDLSKLRRPAQEQRRVNVDLAPRGNPAVAEEWRSGRW